MMNWVQTAIQGIMVLGILIGYVTTETPPPATDALHGLVTDTEGQPLPGIFVTARRAASSIEVTTLTDEAGRYRFPQLDAGTYQVQARQIGFAASASKPYEHTTGGEIDFQIRPFDNVFQQAPSSQFLNLLPEGETKRRFILDCTGCHQFDRTQVTLDGKPRSHASWVERTNQMISFAGGNAGFPIMSPSREAEATADWLVAHLGNADDPLPTLAAPTPTPAAAPLTITEYTLPEQRDLPHDLMPDADGQIVITGMMTARMYRLDPATGVFATLSISPEFFGPRALTIDEAGQWWVLLGGPQKIARYDPATEAYASFGIGMYPHSIVQDEAGKVWFNGHFTKNPELIGALDPTTGTVETYEVPAPTMPDGGSTIPYGLRMGPDGVLWGTQLVGNRLIKFVPEIEQFTMYDLPTTFSGPRRLDIGPDGIVWIPQYAAGKLARFDPQSETFREYDLPMQDALPYIVRVDPGRGAVWIATAAADAVLRFFPSEERFEVYPLPTHRALIRHMELDPETGAAWVAYGNSPSVKPKIARLQVF